MKRRKTFCFEEFMKLLRTGGFTTTSFRNPDEMKQKIDLVENIDLRKTLMDCFISGQKLNTAIFTKQDCKELKEWWWKICR